LLVSPPPIGAAFPRPQITNTSGSDCDWTCTIAVRLRTFAG
jgi:hypothetical protein